MTMQPRRWRRGTTSVATCLASLALAVAAPAIRADDVPPLKVIFDTDISGDVDDVLALAMLHALADRDEIELLAVTISKQNPHTGPFVDATNTFYGRPDVPIGVPTVGQVRQSRYTQLAEQRDGGAFRYPHDLLSNEAAPESVPVLRETLAGQPDGSVVVIQVGTATNLARLLQSPGDAISPLAGVDLVRRKAKLLSIMAGAFTPIAGDDHYLEANVRNDVPSMRTLADLWPEEVPVVWSGFEIGIATRYPRESIREDFGYVPHHIVREAYLLHSGPNHDRPSWDQTSVLYAVRPDRGYFTLSEPGRVSVAEDGFTKFTPKADGRDRYLIYDGTQQPRALAAIVLLTSQPPLPTLPPESQDTP